MSESNKMLEARIMCKQLADVFNDFSDDEVREFQSDSSFAEILLSILNPESFKDYANLQEYLLANKWRSTLIAKIQKYIQQEYAFSGLTEEGTKAFISPLYIQWFEDGVMFLSGKKRFAGLIGLYKGADDLSYALFSRDFQKGEILSKESTEFIDVLEVKKLFRNKINQSELRKPLNYLRDLLNKKCNDESLYQELVSDYPWIWGTRYSKIDRHVKLDDENIPDLIGTRSKDKCCDIFEMKPPFTKMFRHNSKPTQAFNDSWDQAIRYLDFARVNSSYLNDSKGLTFSNPKCFLVLGYDLKPEEYKHIERKMKMNPAMEVYTYNDLVNYVDHSIQFIENLKDLPS